MKRLSIFIGLLVSFNLFAQSAAIIAKAKKPQVKENQEIKIQSIRNGSNGGAPYVISSEGKKLGLIDIELLSKEQQKEINEGDGKIVDLGKMDVVVVKESGHFPNPMVESTVFKPLIKDGNALVRTCAKGMMGCAPYIQVADKNLLIDQQMAPSNIIKRNDELISVSVKGYISSEKGHFPNPTAYIDVFKTIEMKENGVVYGSSSNKIDDSTESYQRNVDDSIDKEDLPNFGSNQ